MTLPITSPLNPTPPSSKKDYQGPLYAPWWKVEEGKRKFREWLKKHSETHLFTFVVSFDSDDKEFIRMLCIEQQKNVKRLY